MNWIQYGAPMPSNAIAKRRIPPIERAEPQNPADQGEQDTLDEQLLDDAAASRAERYAHRDFTRALRRPGQQQIGDVRAGDQKHERDGAHEREQHEPERSAAVALVERHDRGANVLVGVGIVAREGGCDRLEFRAGLRDRHTGREAAEHLQISHIAFHLGQVRQQRERHPQVGVDGELEPLRHHSDHRREHFVHFDRAPDNRWIAPVPSLPDAVPEDHHRLRSRAIVVCREITSEKRPLTDQIERICGHVRAAVSLRHSAAVADVHHRVSERRQPCERSRAPAPVFVVLEGDTAISIACVARAQRHDAIGFVEGEAADQHGVHECEHGVVHADAERERQHGGHGEGGLLAKHARRVAHVLPEIPDERAMRRSHCDGRRDAGLTEHSHLLREHLRLAQFLERETAGLDIRCSAVQELLVAQIKMLRELLDDF